MTRTFGFLSRHRPYSHGKYISILTVLFDIAEILPGVKTPEIVLRKNVREEFRCTRSPLRREASF